MITLITFWHCLMNMESLLPAYYAFVSEVILFMVIGTIVCLKGTDEEEAFSEAEG